jgi:hypothetical protein
VPAAMGYTLAAMYNKKKKESRGFGNQEIKEENILEVVLGNYELF